MSYFRLVWFPVSVWRLSDVGCHYSKAQGMSSWLGRTWERRRWWREQTPNISLPGWLLVTARSTWPFWLWALDVHLQGGDQRFDLCSSCVPLNCFEPQLLIYLEFVSGLEGETPKDGNFLDLCWNDWVVLSQQQQNYVLDKEFSVFISPWQSVLVVLSGLLMFPGSVPKEFGSNILANASFNLLPFSSI